MRSVDSFPVDDVFSFRDGKLRSRYLLLHGFSETPYLAFLEKEASEAEQMLISVRVNNNSAEEMLVLTAIVLGDEIDIKMEILREGESSEYLHFSGKAPVARVGFRSLAG